MYNLNSVLNILESISVDVFGDLFVRTQCCALCKKEKMVAEFYVQSRKGKISSEYGRRSLCKTCYCATNGKYLEKPLELKPISIDNFF